MASSLCKTSVLRIYKEVIEDVISGVRELFVEDGVDEQVLQELRHTWETKLTASKAIQNEPPSEEKPKKQDMVSNGFAKTSQQLPHQQAQALAPAPASASIQSVVETKMVPIQITLPPQPGSDGGQRVLTIQVPATALQGNQLQKVLTGPVITATMGLPPAIASSLLQQHVNAAFNSQQQTTVISRTGPVQLDGTFQDDSGDNHVKIEVALSSRSTKKKSSRKPELPSFLNSASAFHSSFHQVDGSMDTSDEGSEGSDDEQDDLDDLDDDKDEEERDEGDGIDEGGEEEPLNSEDDVSDEDPTDLFDTDNIVVCQYDKIIRNRNKWKFYLKDGIMNLNTVDYVFQKANGDAEW
ncbi:transcription initiation factor IIA subunit 1-like [Anthonomus grandis grandis]|uniref:transcription initiation factor IIA subunit 1-like n=1 Tax=Anthonomus grandis grandis TaxID=2921223 RepID=UPI002165D9DA|nr:transcription initiation factor IIA subunit 1-like [Anthonomus grandis grandis]